MVDDDKGRERSRRGEREGGWRKEREKRERKKEQRERKENEANDGWA